MMHTISTFPSWPPAAFSSQKPLKEAAMPAAAPAFSAETDDDVAIVRDFLDASMKPDAERAASFIGKNFKLTFTGGRTYDHPSGSIGFNAKRYRWVKKSMDRFDVVPGADETIVYSIGTLYGEWPDGTAFKDNRYVDRFVVRGGKIVRMDVWNDSAERILVRKGIDA
jgi:ketosteroid isomerase-like protein